ncbi:TonB-dependent hemoglobin/transferrin/lactoferrin family receptor [Otariodibacter oris]|uniref:Hemoglobin/transferrin/lactoferrin receptor protein n=1 Tax=Otariodibacter oris TaxID=1032623 RepID=A0A420XI65_9PAST|nr:TonB-dependent hemoglobin/transferrin/lactoferrin family receptor [Otariodibacter oris]QGM80877.1 hypothetical protein A6A10_05415 [Otariodibacter oris]RKR76949.1 hemoglobin/transferrin/lactoferrin receptor protein [Otariodibacter oris]
MSVLDHKTARFSLITLALFSYCGSIALAAENDEVSELDTITVTPGQDGVNTPNKKVAETVKTSRTLEKQQVQNSRDLVRYDTGITVVETGRFGSSGFAIRGVDENRVAITVDGLHQAEALSSQGFKELFEGYGNFNNTRNSVEMETLKQVTINKGANSVKVGSGALGGSVVYETKDARDLLIDRDFFYSIKGGLADANKQAYHSQTLAGRYKWFDVLAVYTKRNQHQLKNFDYSHYDNAVFGQEREKADPYHIQKESTLVKLGFQPNEENRLSFTFDGYTNKARGHDYSYNLTPRSASDFGRDNFTDVVGQRYTDDKSTRKNYAITFENYSQTPLWDSMKVTFSDQKIKNRARTEEYCRGDYCQEIANPIGLKVDSANVVDSNGGIVDIVKTAASTAGLTSLQDSQGNLHNAGYSLTPVNEYYFDCTIFDCNSNITTYLSPQQTAGRTGQDIYYEKHNIDLTKDRVSFDTSIDGFDDNWDPIIEHRTYNVDVTDEEFNNKKYKKLSATYTQYSSFLERNVDFATRDIFAVLPASKGFLERDWKERDLDTDTKQINLDFTKYLSIKNTEHEISYGGSYAETKKRMVNRQGYDATNPQWWAETYAPDCSAPGVAGNALSCPVSEGETSFLVPVKSKEGALYIADEIQFNSVFGIDFGYRFDKIKYKPNYKPGISPKIPDGMVEGLFIPLETLPEEPRWWTYQSQNDPNYLRDLAEYNRIKEANDKNAEANIQYFSQKKKFNSNSYSFGMNLDPLDFLKVQAKYSRGFRAPTHEELYFTFRHPDFTIKPNVDLEPEIAKTKEIAFTFHKNNSFITLSGFKTDYDNFLDLRYVGVQRVNINANSALDFDIYQNVNRQNASVKGFEVNSLLSLGDVYSNLEGFTVGWKFTKQKGKVLTENDGRVPMNAIQPTTAVYSIGYASPSGKFGGDIYVTHASAKKAKDTYNMFWRNEQALGDPINGKEVSDSSSHWLSKSYTTLDFIGFVRPIEDLTVRFGAYNITNKKYITWDSARSIRSFGTTNRVRKSDGLGLNRFTAPGRNFRLDLEYVF